MKFKFQYIPNKSNQMFTIKGISFFFFQIRGSTMKKIQKKILHFIKNKNFKNLI